MELEPNANPDPLYFLWSLVVKFEKVKKLSFNT